MKRIRRSALSLLMVLSLCLSLCLPAIAAGGPPYSQPYLQGVSGLTYQAVLEIYRSRAVRIFRGERRYILEE